MVKVRLQLAGEGGMKGSKSPIHIFRTVLKNEGPLALYKGLDAGLIRQVGAELPHLAPLCSPVAQR